MSRKLAAIRLVDLEDGMPTVEQARLRMQYELQHARQDGYIAVKLIHGYGSSGVGGALRVELQKELRKAVRDGAVRAFVAGGGWVSFQENDRWLPAEGSGMEKRRELEGGRA